MSSEARGEEWGKSSAMSLIWRSRSSSGFMIFFTVFEPFFKEAWAPFLGLNFFWEFFVICFLDTAGDSGLLTLQFLLIYLEVGDAVTDFVLMVDERVMIFDVVFILYLRLLCIVFVCLDNCL